jgi:RNA polymerase primary sigma factor
MHENYRIAALKQLRDQLRYAPRDTKLAQADRAEKLLEELQPGKTYTYEYICFRITEYRPQQFPGLKMAGHEASHDLRLFVEDVTDAAGIEAQAVGEPVFTVDDLSRQFRVSTKTIARWRQKGLVSRRFMFDGRKRVGFLQSSVNRFLENNGDRVEQSGKFSQLSGKERHEIIERARRLAQAGGCPSEVTRRVASKMGRSVETVRYTLKQFDKEHPELAIFPGNSGPLTDETKKKIYQLYRRETSVDALAKQFCRTRTSIYRVINEMRAQRILELPLDYIPNPMFGQPGVAAEILAPMPEEEKAGRKTRPPAGLPSYLASLYDSPLLTREQEQHLFRRFNFLKHQASALRDKLMRDGKLDASRAKTRLLDDIERLYEEVVTVKNEIVRRNLRLVVSIAKRHVGPRDNFFELVSDGNVSLIRAVEKFDFARGNKFSTYATWAIMKNYARTIPDENKHRDRYRTSQEEMFEGAADARTDQLQLEAAQAQRAEQVGRILQRLDEREQKIIISRFGLLRGTEPLTLKGLL